MSDKVPHNQLWMMDTSSFRVSSYWGGVLYPRSKTSAQPSAFSSFSFPFAWFRFSCSGSEMHLSPDPSTQVYWLSARALESDSWHWTLGPTTYSCKPLNFSVAQFHLDNVRELRFSYFVMGLSQRTAGERSETEPVRRSHVFTACFPSPVPATTVRPAWDFTYQTLSI